MRHLRSDYDAIQPFPQKRPHTVKIDGVTVDAGDEHLGKHMDPIIPEDEPVFLIRAKDVVGPAVVRTWAHMAAEAGADPDLCLRVAEWADEMELYATHSHTGPQVPDTPEGRLR